MLEIVPISFKEAKDYVNKYHRHLKATMKGCKFVIAVSNNDIIVGVAIVGRPIARYLNDGWTLEINRTCTDGTKNVNSMLYAACWRVAKNMGYKKLITYIRKDETGNSLKAANFKIVAEVKGRLWNNKSRPRVENEIIDKLRFEIIKK